MKARKLNMEYTIDVADVESYRKEGFDIFNDDGTLYGYGVGKSVPYEKYAKLEKVNEELQNEVIALKEELAKAKKKKG